MTLASKMTQGVLGSVGHRVANRAVQTESIAVLRPCGMRDHREGPFALSLSTSRRVVVRNEHGVTRLTPSSRHRVSSPVSVR